ncbi:MAG: chemotaxis protein CheB [Vulcanimicrobiota bacterium]
MQEQPWVVGIGASAGGLQALQLFFQSVPVSTGLAFIVVQHLSPDHRSLMIELLSRHTNLRVSLAEPGVEVQPNQIYLNPPAHNLVYRGGQLQLLEREERVLNFPVDLMLESLARELGRKAMAVILSGTGSDGARGVRAIKDAGGLVVVQQESQAQFDGMPRSALNSGAVDFSLPAETMIDHLLHFKDHSTNWEEGRGDLLLTEVMDALQVSSGMDFHGYKKDTVMRRIERRLSLLHVSNLSDYLRHLESNAEETRQLFQELLIGVTRFFRDSEAFLVLAKQLKALVTAQTNKRAELRCWVAGCSTGEEVYSLAILLAEVNESLGLACPFKIFATDIDSSALEVASKGLYPESISEDVSPERLEKFFLARDQGFEVVRQLRERVVFARHNLVQDPPFHQLDLISCRNLLIYFDSDFQRRALSSLHFGLRPGGFLFLGPSESVGELTDYFVSLDSKARIYQTLGVIREPQRWKARPGEPPVATVVSELALAVEAGYRIVLDRFCPPAFLINQKGELLHVFSDAQHYLTFSHGNVRVDLPSLLPPRLAALVLSGLSRCCKDGDEVEFPQVEVTRDASTLTVSLRMRCFRPRRISAVYILVLFEELASRPQAAPLPLIDTGDQDLAYLQHELDLTREHLQSTIEQLETANEELQATNEELQAANQELMSSNEELQSVNEELYTLNSEHQLKIRELTRLNQEIESLLSATGVATLLVDADMHILRSSPALLDYLNVLPGDIGRPVSHITLNFDFPEFLDVLARVIREGRIFVQDFCGRKGNEFRVSIQPFLSEGSDSGALVNFLDTSDRIQAGHFKSLFDSMGACLAVLEPGGEIVQVNRAWCEFAEANGGAGAAEAWLGVNYLNHLGGDVNLRANLERVLQGRQSAYQMVYPCHAPGEKRYFLLTANYWARQPGALVLHSRLPEAAIKNFEGLA